MNNQKSQQERKTYKVFNCGSHVAEEHLHLPKTAKILNLCVGRFHRNQQISLTKRNILLLFTVNTLIYIALLKKKKSHFSFYSLTRMRYLIFNPKIFKQLTESIGYDQLSFKIHSFHFKCTFLYVAAELLKVGTAI